MRITLISSRVVIKVPGLIKVPGVTLVSPRTPVNGARMTRSPQRDWPLTTGAGGFQRRLRLFGCYARCDAPLGQGLKAIIFPLGLGHLGACLNDPGVLFPGPQLHQRCSGGDPLAVGEQDPGDQLRGG